MEDRTDLEVLEQAVINLGARCKEIERILNTHTSYIEKLRVRLNSILPELHYCPHCRAPVSAHARACRSCGKSWGPPDQDPKAGLPQ